MACLADADEPSDRLPAPGTGAKAKLAPADRILIIVLRLRKLATRDVLGHLFGVTAMTISRAKQRNIPRFQAHQSKIKKACW